jgi:hypothetical protein
MYQTQCSEIETGVLGLVDCAAEPSGDEFRGSGVGIPDVRSLAIELCGHGCGGGGALGPGKCVYACEKCLLRSGEVREMEQILDGIACVVLIPAGSCEIGSGEHRRTLRRVKRLP